MKEFLKRKNIVISADRYGIDALGAMAQGLFCSLLIGTILNTLGAQFHIGFLTAQIVKINDVGYTIGGLASFMSGAAMAVAGRGAVRAAGGDCASGDWARAGTPAIPPRSARAPASRPSRAISLFPTRRDPDDSPRVRSRGSLAPVVGVATLRAAGGSTRTRAEAQNAFSTCSACSTATGPAKQWETSAR